MPRCLHSLAGAFALAATACFALFALASLHAQNRVVFHAPQSAPVRAQAPITANETQSVTLAGNTHPLADVAQDQGLLPSSTQITGMLLSLAPTAEQEAALDALLRAQQDPTSPSYHQWLTPSQFGSRFGLTPDRLAQVAQWLASHGFTVTEVAPSARLITFAGTAAQVQEAFHSELHRYTVAGVTHIANAQDPQIPTALSSSVSGVVSLNDFHSTSTLATRKAIASTAAAASSTPHPLYSAGSTHYLFPADFATIYNVAPLTQAGLDGAGVTIAVAGRSNILLSDVATFRSMAGLSAKAPTVVLPTTDPGLSNDDRDEATLDVEWAAAIAPAANVTLVTAPSYGTTDGIDLAASYIVNHAIGSIVSVSYANCESAMGATKLSFYNALWKQAAAQGQTVFVASGDSGAAACQSATTSKGAAAAVNGMCSSPYATCVGGTEFNESSTAASYWLTYNSTSNASALGYIPETVWNESAANGGVGLWASGGGASRIYAQPTWQAGVSGIVQANGMRAVPDLALSAAIHDGSIIVEDATLYVVSGTSVATPSLAGIFARAVQKAGKDQGNANPRFYELAASTPAAFHPTPEGNNTVPGVAGYTAAGATYNLATGLGSVDSSMLVNNWIAGPDFTLSASSSSNSLAAGQTATVTLSVLATGSALNSVQLAATAPSGITVSFGSSSVTAGSATSVTISVAASASAGDQRIQLTGTNASGSQSATFTLNVRSTSACTTAASGLNAHCGVTVPVPLG